MMDHVILIKASHSSQIATCMMKILDSTMKQLILNGHHLEMDILLQKLIS